jgi:hypothetical protein
VDPVEWKTELERVGPKLRANQQLTTNEWRAHVDQTVTSKGHIEKVLGDTQGDLHAMNKYALAVLFRVVLLDTLRDCELCEEAYELVATPYGSRISIHCCIYHSALTSACLTCTHLLTRTRCMCHHRHVSDELNKMRMKEKYLNNQHNSMSLSFIEVKHKLESLEQKSSATHEKVRLLFFCTV